MLAPPKITFEGPPSGAAYEAWREEYCRKVISCDLSPLSGGMFSYEVMPVQLTASVALLSSHGSAMHYRTHAIVDKLVLLIPDSAPLDMRTDRREALIMPGQVSFGDSGVQDAVVVQRTAGAFRSIIFDRRTLLASCPTAEDLIARPALVDAAALTLLRAYEDIVRNESHRFNGPTASIVGQHLIDLTALVLGAGDRARITESGSVAAARFEIVKADILAQLSNPGFTIVALAARHRVSVRYVQYLFERAGTSFTEFVLEQRLLIAKRLLASPIEARRKIADIALLAGFNSISYFHRAFRQRFGMTPTEARAKMKSGSG